ncbi:MULTISPECIES: hypothetical protein [Enterococcus]|uniref:hypothetical protein n=1 Tax=Enterococcus TaxID=1350 RepID=UPI0022E2BE6A|nr:MULTISPECIES: hypothetical protein [Enterococcus]
MNVLILTKCVFAEEELVKKLNLLGYEVFCSNHLLKELVNEATNYQVINYFPNIIFSETVSDDEMWLVAKNESMSVDNKSAKDIYTFGTIFLGDNFLGSNANAKGTHSENVLPTFSSELVEENREVETKSSATMEVEMENANDSNGQLAMSGPEDETATVDEVTQADHLVETSDEVEIEDILKEQNELLNSLVGFEADSL